jgi:hypothetical protein
MGRQAIFDEKWQEADQELSDAFRYCLPSAKSNLRKILQLLIPVRLVRGVRATRCVCVLLVGCMRVAGRAAPVVCCLSAAASTIGARREGAGPRRWGHTQQEFVVVPSCSRCSW